MLSDVYWLIDMVCITKNNFKTLCFICSLAFMLVGESAASEAVVDYNQQKRSAIQKFLQKIAPKIDNAEQNWQKSDKQQIVTKPDTNILPEGEILFLTVRLPQRLKLQGVIFAQSRNEKIVLSLKDFIEVMQFPIIADLENGKIVGWYIREHKDFALDLNEKSVLTDHGQFEISESVFIEDDDIFVPIAELAKWIDFEMRVRVSGQELVVTPSELLPQQEQQRRRSRKNNIKTVAEAKLPLPDTKAPLVDFPVLDLITTTSWDKDGNTNERKFRNEGNVTSRGQIADGTLTTRVLYDNEDYLRRVTANYKQESNNQDLLGPLKARRFEIGDTTTTPLPLLNNTEQDLGVRVTNRDPLKTFTNPSSVISGTTFPEWDVELYRGNQFIGVQTVDENGFFSFDDVDLFSQDNDFRLLFYGPQGEIREEIITIPLDRDSFSNSGGIYDVSLTFEDEDTYSKDRAFRNEDSGSLNVNALFEQPIGQSSAVSLGLNSEQNQGTRNYIGQAGLSTLVDRTLLNLNVAVDDELDSNAELTLRRSFGEHDISSTTNWINQGFDLSDSDEADSNLFNSRISAVGPLPFLSRFSGRYSASTNLQKGSNEQDRMITNIGANARWRGLSLNHSFNYLNADNLPDNELTGLTTLAGTFGKNRLRTIANYDIKPDPEISNLLFRFVHEFSDDLDIRAEIDRTFDISLTEASLSVDWQSGLARLSPRIEVNSDNDLFIGLTSRLSAFREPHSGDIVTVDRAVSGNGGFSAFVFLDTNGNLLFDQGEKPLEGVVIKALQNGGVETTNQNGLAIFTNMRELKRTDIIIEERSLNDPLWISAKEGVSIIPQEGNIANATFPIQVVGEIDGTVIGVSEAGERVEQKNIGIDLHNLNGELVKSTVTDFGGFYFFSRVPPGHYYLSINHKSASANGFEAPLPRQVHIGYDGTLLFGQDLQVQLNRIGVPLIFVEGFDVYKSLNTHADITNDRNQFVLNLGEFGSRMHMRLVWYKLQRQFSALKYQTMPLHSLKESKPDPKTKKHNLRVLFKGQDFDAAHKLCKKIIDADRSCAVEIMLFNKNISTAQNADKNNNAG